MKAFVARGGQIFKSPRRQERVNPEELGASFSLHVIIEFSVSRIGLFLQRPVSELVTGSFHLVSCDDRITVPGSEPCSRQLTSPTQIPSLLLGGPPQKHDGPK